MREDAYLNTVLKAVELKTNRIKLAFTAAQLRHRCYDCSDCIFRSTYLPAGVGDLAPRLANYTPTFVSLPIFGLWWGHATSGRSKGEEMTYRSN